MHHRANATAEILATLNRLRELALTASIPTDQHAAVVLALTEAAGALLHASYTADDAEAERLRGEAQVALAAEPMCRLPTWPPHRRA